MARNSYLYIQAFIVALFVKGALYASPAYPNKTSVVVENGDTILISLKGDEYCKYALTEDSITIIQKDNSWFYAISDSLGNAVVSSYKVQDKKTLSMQFRDSLLKESQNIIPISSSCEITRYSTPLSSALTPVIGERKVLVILMAFKNRGFYISKESFDALFNQKNYTYDGAQGSVYDYYYETSYGKLDLKSEIYGPYISKYEMSYYGRNLSNGNDKNPYALFLEAIEYVSKEVNLQEFDCNGDGYIDNVHIIYAGYGEEAGAQSDAIWAHKQSFSDISIQGLKINCYSCSPELRGNNGYGITRIGACCHEIGHALGAMDFYDTNYSTGGAFDGTGKWDIMASGSWNNDGITPAHFNPYIKVFNFGWSSIIDIEEEGKYVINTSSICEDQIYRLKTSSDNDFYLLENRIKSGFDLYIPGEGLMIYHIHPDIEDKLPYNTVNASFPQMMYPICAASGYEIPNSSPASYGTINSDATPFPGSSNNHSFGYNTTPKLFAWDNSERKIKIKDIEYLEKEVSFSYVDENEEQEDFENIDIYRESFESEEWENSWGKTGNSSTCWLRDSVSNGDFNMINSPQYAPHGNYFLSLKNATIIAENRISRIELLPLIENNDNSYSVSFQYMIISTTNGAKLHVNFSDEQGNLISSHTISKSNLDWENATFKVPDFKVPLRFSIEGEIKGKGSVYIDDILFNKEVVSDIETSYNSQVYTLNIYSNNILLYSDSSIKMALYPLNGCLLYEKDDLKHSLTLSPGIYFLRISDNIQKVIIR